LKKQTEKEHVYTVPGRLSILPLADNPRYIIEAYIGGGEGIDHAVGYLVEFWGERLRAIIIML
jgi:hypothetical protein